MAFLCCIHPVLRMIFVAAAFSTAPYRVQTLYSLVPSQSTTGLMAQKRDHFIHCSGPLGTIQCLQVSCYFWVPTQPNKDMVFIPLL